MSLKTAAVIDRFEEIKALRAAALGHVDKPGSKRNIDWLIAEVDRLRQENDTLRNPYEDGEQ